MSEASFPAGFFDPPEEENQNVVTPEQAPSVRKTRAKRTRWWLIESRSIPSKLGKLFFAAPGVWSEQERCAKVANARRLIAEVDTHHDLSPGFFARGTEYRIRRIDPPLVLSTDQAEANYGGTDD